MLNTINDLLTATIMAPETIEFSQVTGLIDNHYHFTETSFSNGTQHNAPGQNSGSCKVFSFALLHELSEAQTLALFAQHYRNDVLNFPDGDDHQNIRQFMITGFAGLSFNGVALTPK